MMKAVSLLLIAGLASTAWGQAPTDVFEKAPPGVDEALRERVNAFYKTWMEGKFRAGEKFVAEDAQEFYYQMQKQKFESCEIIRLKYERDFNDAIVTVACKGKWNISGQELETKLAHTDFWSLEKDQWARSKSLTKRAMPRAKRVGCLRTLCANEAACRPPCG